MYIYIYMCVHHWSYLAELWTNAPIVRASPSWNSSWQPLILCPNISLLRHLSQILQRLHSHLGPASSWSHPIFFNSHHSKLKCSKIFDDVCRMISDFSFYFKTNKVVSMFHLLGTFRRMFSQEEPPNFIFAPAPSPECLALEHWSELRPPTVPLPKSSFDAGWWFYITILKNDGVKVNGFRMTPHIWNGKLKSCLKPPTRICFSRQKMIKNGNCTLASWFQHGNFPFFMALQRTRCPPPLGTRTFQGSRFAQSPLPSGGRTMAPVPGCVIGSFCWGMKI